MAVGIPFAVVFLGRFGFVRLKELGLGVLQNSVSRGKLSRFIPSHKNAAFLTMLTNILTFPQ
jgi:hypothetical protein